MEPLQYERLKFMSAYTLPYAAIAKKQEIDHTCPSEGKTQAEAHRAQNRTKNELCAAEAPVTVTHQTFHRPSETRERARHPLRQFEQDSLGRAGAAEHLHDVERAQGDYPNMGLAPYGFNDRQTDNSERVVHAD